MEAHDERTDEERAYYALNRKVFSILAPFYDLVTWPVRRLRREVADLVPAGSQARVLDVATGTGAQALAFAKNAREVIGVDLSQAMLRMARRKNRSPHVAFCHADATELPFQDHSFDVSCISFGLHEMPRSVRERVLREMARVTRPGGAIVVVDYALPRNALAAALVYRLVKLYERGHYADFVRSDLAAMLRAAGIEPREHRPVWRGLAEVVTATPRTKSAKRAIDPAPPPVAPGAVEQPHRE